MKTLISEYAGIVIAVFVGLGVLSMILFSSGQDSGILGIAGEVMRVQTKNFFQEQDHTSYDGFMEQGSLAVSYIDNCPIYAEDIITVEEHFQVTDTGGNPVAYEVVDLYDNAGNPCYDQVRMEQNKLQFSIAGVYQILIETKGQGHKNISAVIPFPVKAKNQQNKAEE